MVVDGDELVEAQRVAALGDDLLGFCIPVFFQAAVDFGKAAGQRRIDNYRQLVPGAVFAVLFHLLVDDVFDFVQQFLGTADTERGDKHTAAVLQCALDGLAQGFGALFAVFVDAVAVGAFYYQFVATLGWGWAV